MTAQEDPRPTDAKPTQAQGAAGSPLSAPSTPGREPPRDGSRPAPMTASPSMPATGIDPALRSTVDDAFASARANEARANDARADEAMADDLDDRDDLGADLLPRRRHHAGHRGRAGRSYRGLDLSLHDFRHELSAIADDVGYLLRNESVVNPELKAQLEERFERLRGTVTLMAGDAREAGLQLRDEVHDQVEQRIRASRGAVQERPITSVAMAAIVGLSVGLLLSRRR